MHWLSFIDIKLYISLISISIQMKTQQIPNARLPLNWGYGGKYYPLFEHGFTFSEEFMKSALLPSMTALFNKSSLLLHNIVINQQKCIFISSESESDYQDFHV